MDKNRATTAREVSFGAPVASTFWTERPAIETTTSVDISVRNYVWHGIFSVKSYFRGGTSTWCKDVFAVGSGRLLISSGCALTGDLEKK